MLYKKIDEFNFKAVSARESVIFHYSSCSGLVRSSNAVKLGVRGISDKELRLAKVTGIEHITNEEIFNGDLSAIARKLSNSLTRFDKIAISSGPSCAIN